MNLFPSQFIMISQEAANDALDTTLAAVQSLMKRCMKLKEADPETLRLSDEIARQVAKDLKLYAGNATSFSPLLLSCAAVIWQHSQGGTFESVPDWTSVAADDPRIKSHPQFKKTVDYRPPSVLDVSLLATSSAIPTTFPTPPPHIVPPLTTSALASMPSRADPDIIAKPVAEPKQSSHLRARKNPPLFGRQAGPPARFHHLYVDKITQRGVFEVGDSKERKADYEDMDGAVVIEIPKSPSPSQQPLKKKRKFKSNVETRPTRIIYVKPKLKALLPVTTDKDVPLGDDQGFRDAETLSKPAEWGSDAYIATPCQHSVRYHPRKCDKCTKLDIPCIVLLDKKFGCTRLACANCDLMKVNCVIDGVGVRKRMQAKAAAAASNSAEHSGTCIRKSRMISRVKLNIAEEAEQQPGLPADVLMKTLAIISTSQRPKQGDQFAPTNRANPKPTARDILQGIQDLGRKFDLLATNERVDTLDVRVHSVETILHQRLDALEQRLNASDAW
ncbi:uncharacterized protein F5147DRAFT_652566 [Suillus discolor]|uniref:Uncharacterized protein n=1 Tax=Suillus discolor TaxID=1912936 RepID=A0A9P7JUI9_9AGAM|nr:uncharacterized protein F5147DRAFT_652566 [Suillus discolor]KAG2108988.1 hypothetical protein F5147DRAFT_652566 [Suillus discolor]